MGRVPSIAAMLGFLTGCGLVLDFGQETDQRDAGGGRSDASIGRDADRQDSGAIADAQARVDGGPADCARSFDGDVLALYRFDGDLVDSVGAGPSGTVIGPYGFVDTGTDCGHDLTFYGPPVPGSGYATLPASPVWQQPEGAIDLWLRLDEHDGASASGVLSRDATGVDGTGHFTLLVTASRQLALRLQSTTDTDEALCSAEPVPLGAWTHIGIQLGTTARLFIDGVQQSFAGRLVAGDEGIRLDCAGPQLSDRSIQGNDEPWVIGAASWRSMPGTPTPTSAPLVGAVDHLRFWSTPVDFSAP